MMPDQIAPNPPEELKAYTKYDEGQGKGDRAKAGSHVG